MAGWTRLELATSGVTGRMKAWGAPESQKERAGDRWCRGGTKTYFLKEIG